MNIDQTGPLFYPNQDLYSKDKHLSAYILLAVKLVSYRTHLVLIKSLGVLDVIKGMEQLQNMRGSLCNIILDSHITHKPLLTEGPKDKQTRLTQILAGNSNILEAEGIRLTLAPRK